MPDDPGFVTATRHVKRMRDFFYHLMVFVFTGALFVVLDLRVDAGNDAVFGLDWAYWIVLFWGLGVAGHGIWAFFDDARAERIYVKTHEPIHH